MDKARTDIDRLMRQHGSQLLRLCTMLLQDASEAQDAVQDTFLKAYRSWGGWRGEASEKTWLTAIAVNVCRDHRRSAWFRRIVRDKDVADLPERGVPFPFPDDTVITAVMALPDSLREVILLYYYQNFTSTEIAEILGISQPAVSERLKRARRQLREALREDIFHEA